MLGRIVQEQQAARACLGAITHSRGWHTSARARGRRNGKPTSLGCFDHEEQAARAYDKMMLWCELHNTSGVKGGITNFDPTEYEKDLHHLSLVTQARTRPSDQRALLPLLTC